MEEYGGKLMYPIKEMKSKTFREVKVKPFSLGGLERPKCVSVKLNKINMSRIGKLPIKVPQNVNIVLEAEQITVKGPMGTLTQVIPNDISITFEQDLITINKLNENISAREKYGLTRSLVQNMVTGVSTRFEKKLQMIGVGYRAQVNGKELNLNVGFSHPVVFNIPEGIEIIVEANTNLIIRGADKEAVGLLASRIRAIRPPEPYKGKGIRYTNEVVLRKAGKSGKK